MRKNSIKEGGKQLGKPSLYSQQWFAQARRAAQGNPEKLAKLAALEKKIMAQQSKGSTTADPAELERKAEIKNSKFNTITQEADVASTDQQPGRNPFDGGTNSVQDPTIEEIRTVSQDWTQRIEYTIEDLTDAMAQGDMNTVRTMMMDLQNDTRAYMGDIAKLSGLKPRAAAKSAPKAKGSSFSNLVTGESRIREAYAVKSGKKSIREATPSAIKLAQTHSLNELKKLYHRAKARGEK
jgi:hypothetical protein